MFEIAIVGAGPAGASAGIFTAKAGKKTIIFDSNKGATQRAMLWNHYGVEEITGKDLVSTGIEQAKKQGAEYIQKEVVSIEKTDQGFILKTEDDQYEAKYVILATGFTTKLGESLGVNVKPGTEPRVKNIFEIDSKGETNIKGVWAAGTVAGVSVHTIITAGDGARVAINLISEINGERYVDHDVLK